MIENLICSANKTLLEAMQLINENALGLCFVVDKFNSLQGVATDGDIRRAILSRKSLDSPIGEILNDNFVFGHKDEPNDKLISKITKEISILPIVDDDNHLVDYYQYSQQIHFPVALPNLGGKELKYLTDAFLSTWISSTGSYIDRFETSFSKYSDCTFGISTSNGTCALHLALKALDIGDGDEVIIPDLTFAATINAVLLANATPVIVDVEEDSWCIDPNHIEKAITSKTKAIIPVHLYGQVCDMDGILRLAKKHNLKIIEDCAEAHGAKFKGMKVGSFGDIGCFSFYGNKVITTGEGGMCTTNNSELNHKLRIMRDHGMSKERRYWHDIVGFNYRLTNLQAAIGVAQMEELDNFIERKRQIAIAYAEGLSTLEDFTLMSESEFAFSTYWLYTIVLNKSESKHNSRHLISLLQDRGIQSRPLWYPVHLQEMYRDCEHYGMDCAHRLYALAVQLPSSSGITDQEIEHVISSLHMLCGE